MLAPPLYIQGLETMKYKHTCARMHTHTYIHTHPTSFPTEVPAAITILQRTWRVAKGQHEGNGKKTSAVHILRLARKVFSLIRFSSTRVEVPEPSLPRRLPSLTLHLLLILTKMNISTLNYNSLNHNSRKENTT